MTPVVIAALNNDTSDIQTIPPHIEILADCNGDTLKQQSRRNSDKNLDQTSAHKLTQA